MELRLERPYRQRDGPPVIFCKPRRLASPLLALVLTPGSLLQTPRDPNFELRVRASFARQAAMATGWSSSTETAPLPDPLPASRGEGERFRRRSGGGGGRGAGPGTGRCRSRARARPLRALDRKSVV